MPQFDIDQHVKVLGCDRAHAENIAESIASKERERLERISPKELSASEREIERAQAQLDKARQGLESRRQIIADLENQITALGEHRAIVAAFVKEFISLPDAQGAADAVFDAWQAAVQNPCNQTASVCGLAGRAAAGALAVRPFVAGKLESLKATEAQLADAITEVARREKIDLDNLLVIMRAEAGLQPHGRHGDESRWKLFASGLLEGITKN